MNIAIIWRIAGARVGWLFVLWLSSFAISCVVNGQSIGESTPVTNSPHSDRRPLTIDAIDERWGQISWDRVRTAAESGDALAQCHLGWRLVTGKGVKTNLAEGANWYRRAAERGLAAAQCELGWMYEKGKGLPKDRPLAMGWTRKAAEQGLTAAEVNLGWMHANDQVLPGQTITGNYPEAAEWYEKAARKGHPNAQYLLAELYHYGKLGKEQRTNCVQWYVLAAQQGHTRAQAAVGTLARSYPDHPLTNPRDTIPVLQQAAEKGNIDAQLQLARRYRSGDGVATNLVEAFRWMQLAAANEAQSTRVVDAWHELACMYETGQGVARNPSQAWPLYLSAAEANPDAQFRVGRMYEEGTGVPQDKVRAAQYYARAGLRGWGTHQFEAAARALALYVAGHGLPSDKEEAEKMVRRFESMQNPHVRYLLGEVYFQGKGVTKDAAVAAEYFAQAAKAGSPEAQNRIGQMWAAGLQGQADQREAANWYRNAANQGLAEAQFNLGLCFAKSEGVPLDRVQAWQWLQLAADQGVAGAQREREAVERNMSSEQIAQARAKVASFKPVKMAVPPWVVR